MIYKFEDFELDTSRYALSRCGDFVAIEPKVFMLLELLVTRRGNLIAKDEIIDQVWDGRVISDSVVNTTIRSVRKALGDDGKAQTFVRTFHGRGYKFVADVEECAMPPTARDDKVASWSGRPVIAVSPFEYLSDDPKQRYISDVILESIMTALSRLGWISLSMASSRLADEQIHPLLHSGERALIANGAYTLEGSVQKVGDRVRVTVRLIDHHTGSHLWSEQYDNSSADIFELQDEISQLAVSQIAKVVTGAEIRTSSDKAPVDQNAWDCYMRGLAHFHERTSEKYATAQILFEKAIDLDPNLAEAYVALSQLHASRLGCFVVEHDNEDHRDICLDLARKAVELDGAYGASRLALGICHTHRQEYDQAFEQLSEAIVLNPSDALSHRWLGAAKMYSGSAEKALPHLKRAVGLSTRDPLRGPHMMHLGFCYLFLGEFDVALSWARKALHEPTASKLADALFLAVCGHLGTDEALSAELETVKGRLIKSTRISEVLSPLVRNSAYGDFVIAGLRKASIAEVRRPERIVGVRAAK